MKASSVKNQNSLHPAYRTDPAPIVIRARYNFFGVVFMIDPKITLIDDYSNPDRKPDILKEEHALALSGHKWYEKSPGSVTGAFWLHIILD
jgi:hypothetical protein